MLDQRTRIMHKELGNLQQRIGEVEGQLRAELDAKVVELRREADELRAELAKMQSQAARIDATALPIIAIGVVLGGLAPELARLPVVIWVVVMLAATALTIGLSARVVRAHRAAAS